MDPDTYRYPVPLTCTAILYRSPPLPHQVDPETYRQLEPLMGGVLSLRSLRKAASRCVCGGYEGLQLWWDYLGASPPKSPLCSIFQLARQFDCTL